MRDAAVAARAAEAAAAAAASATVPAAAAPATSINHRDIAAPGAPQDVAAPGAPQDMPKPTGLRGAVARVMAARGGVDGHYTLLPSSDDVEAAAPAPMAAPALHASTTLPVVTQQRRGGGSPPPVAATVPLQTLLDEREARCEAVLTAVYSSMFKVKDYVGLAANELYIHHFFGHYVSSEAGRDLCIGAVRWNGGGIGMTLTYDPHTRIHTHVHTHTHTCQAYTACCCPSDCLTAWCYQYQ
jgi:hypothetical protein